MISNIPDGSRRAARVLLVDENNQVLFLKAREGNTDNVFWLLPGGGLEGAETFEEAAVREVKEETGMTITLGPCLWTRHHVFEWLGVPQDQFEVFFISKVNVAIASNVQAAKPDDYVIGHRWWQLNQIENTTEKFAPTKVAELLRPIMRGNYPATPFDCGV